MEPRRVARVHGGETTPASDATSTPMTERRYDDDEVRDILARATEVRDEPVALPDPETAVARIGHHLSLAELQDVAAQAGIAPDLIAEAAAALEIDQATLPAPQVHYGVPISAAHVVHLRRMLEPDEWDRFVVRLRDTFDATGTVRTEGSLQTWSNGFLNVLLEPLEDGARLRFQSVHGESKGYIEGGVAFGASGLFLLGFFLLLGIFGSKPVPLPLVGMSASLPAFGAAMWAAGRSKAARWLPQRRDQFRALGTEAVEVVDAVEDDGGT